MSTLVAPVISLSDKEDVVEPPPTSTYVVGVTFAGGDLCKLLAQKQHYEDEAVMVSL